MRTTGGTDLDWLVEHRGGFIILECKEFHGDGGVFPVSRGQMIAFETLYKKLKSDGKCYFYFFASEPNTDWKNPESPIWYFELSDWYTGKIAAGQGKSLKFWLFSKKDMTEVTINDFRALMENHWKEFEKKIDLKPKLQRSTSKISKKEKAYSIQEIRKTYPRAYEKWTESDDEFLKRFWNKNKQNTKEKIRELMKQFGRNRGAITSRLNKMGFVLN